MELIKSLFLSLLVSLNLLAPTPSPTLTPTPTVTPSPTHTPIPTSTITPTKKPVPHEYSDKDKIRIILDMKHRECLADQKPGAEGYYALVELNKYLISKYGISGEIVYSWDSTLIKKYPDLFDKMVKAQYSPCPIITE
jgi:hypothetical protein